jgi:hypothetical protein
MFWGKGEGLNRRSRGECFRARNYMASAEDASYDAFARPTELCSTNNEPWDGNVAEEVRGLA